MRFAYSLILELLSLSLSMSIPLTHRPPSCGSVKPIWEGCRLGCLLQCPTTVPSPYCHLLVPLQSAAGLPTGQFRWSAVSCHRGHPPWLPLKDNGTVSVTSASLLYTTPLLQVALYGLAIVHTSGSSLVYSLFSDQLKEKSCRIMEQI